MTHFSFQFLGSGNARSKPPANFNTNVFVSAPRGNWLIDCGLLAPLALKNAGISHENVHGAFISHLHGDHIYGIEELLFEGYFRYKRKLDLFLPTPFVQHQGENLWENVLGASMATSVLQSDGSYKVLSFSDYANLTEMLPQNEYDFFGVPVRCFPVKHVVGRSSFGLCLDNRVFFTSDTTFSRDAIESYLKQGAEIIFHDASFLPAKVGGVHASVDELKTLPKDWIKKIVLMHYDDEATDVEKSAAEDCGFRIAKIGQIFKF